MGQKYLKYVLILTEILFTLFWVIEATQEIENFHDGQQQVNDLPHKVCCDIINEANIDLQFFTELCKSVIDREMATEAGIRKYRQGRYPPPGMMERCRQKIRLLCGIDITEALLENRAEKVAVSAKPKMHSQSQELNLTQCLKDNRLALTTLSITRKPPKEILLPSYMHQERPQHISALPVNMAFLERGSPYPHFLIKNKTKTSDVPSPHTKSGQSTALLSQLKDKKQAENGDGIKIVEPIYKLSITIFFIFTMTKMLMKKPQDADNSTEKILNGSHKHVYQNGNSSNVCKGNHTLIATELEDKQLDDISYKMEISEAADEMETAYDDLTEHTDNAEDQLQVEEQQMPEEMHVEEPQYSLTELANHIKRLIEVDDAKIAVLGMEIQAEFPNATTRAVAAQDCESAIKSEEDVEQITSNEELKPIVVTGKMVISLLGKDSNSQQFQDEEAQLVVVGGVSSLTTNES